MTPEHIKLVQGTWTKLAPISDTAAEMFYAKLFKLDPALKPLFKGEMKQQGRKLMTMIGAAVNGLSRLDRIVPVVQDLGRRHAGYGVRATDYDTVGTALVWTLEQGLGDALTPDVRNAWLSVYATLSTTMKDAAAQASA